MYPRTTNKILRAMLLAKKVPEANIMEEYTPFHHQDYQTIVGKIKKFSAGGGGCVISTINGDSNVPFYKEFANQGLRAEDAPIMAFSVAEDELRGMDTTALVGHLAAWNYYQSVDTPQNKKFVADFKAYCKKNNLPDGDKRVTDDPIEAAYFGVHVWKQAVEKAGQTDVDAVRKAVYGQKFLAPGGEIMMDEAQPAYAQAGVDRRDPEGRAVQGCVAVKRIGQAGALERVHESGKGMRLGQVIKAPIRRKPDGDESTAGVLAMPMQGTLRDAGSACVGDEMLALDRCVA